MCIFGIYTNLKKDAELHYTRQVVQALEDRGVPYYFDDALVKAMGAGPEASCRGRKIDVLLVLGGDGTMLTAARKYGPQGTRLLGLNMGRMGFLLDTEVENLRAAIDGILAGKYRIEKRIMLKASILDAEGKIRASAYGLNEAVISQKKVLRIVNVHVAVNGLPVDNWRCDGLIVSTPTGSTGYSLSAGGPVVQPTVDVLLITPICPHTLQSSNIVISGNDEITVRAESDYGSTVLTLDGQDAFEIRQNETVSIKKADFGVEFIRYTDKNFFLLLKEKLAEWVIK